MKKGLLTILMICSVLTLIGCGSNKTQIIDGTDISDEIETDTDVINIMTEDILQNNDTEGDNIMKMKVSIGEYVFTATLEKNEAVNELVDMMKQSPVTVSLDDYAGFEKVGPLGKSLTTSNKQTTTQPGDIVLYSGSNIVMFYGSNSWSYTRLGKIDDLTDWEKALGSGSVTAVFTID